MRLTFSLRCCIAFAKTSTIPKWHKVWNPKEYNGENIRDSDERIDAYIKDGTGDKFDPAKTMRFSGLTMHDKTFNQMAVPFGMLDDLCGYCLPIAEAKKDGRDTRVHYKSGDFLALAKQEVAKPTSEA